MNAVEKKLLFIVNPRAGKTKSRAPLFDAVSIFSKAGYLVRVAETRRHGDATELAERFGVGQPQISRWERRGKELLRQELGWTRPPADACFPSS